MTRLRWSPRWLRTYRRVLTRLAHCHGETVTVQLARTWPGWRWRLVGLTTWSEARGSRAAARGEAARAVVDVLGRRWA